MSDKNIEAFRKFKFEFESDNDARPSQLDTWQHQQKRIDELEAKLAIAVHCLEVIMNESHCELWQVAEAAEALNKIRMQNKSAESDGE